MKFSRFLCLFFSLRKPGPRAGTWIFGGPWLEGAGDVDMKKSGLLCAVLMLDTCWILVGFDLMFVCFTFTYFHYISFSVFFRWHFLFQTYFVGPGLTTALNRSRSPWHGHPSGGALRQYWIQRDWGTSSFGPEKKQQKKKYLVFYYFFHETDCCMMFYRLFKYNF